MGDSNSRHLAPKASALPTALIPDFWLLSFAPDVVKHVVRRFFWPSRLAGKVPVSQAYQGIADTVFSSLKGERPAPKPRVLSAEPHPDIQFLPLYHGEGDNQRLFCLWSPAVKPACVSRKTISILLKSGAKSRPCAQKKFCTCRTIHLGPVNKKIWEIGTHELKLSYHTNFTPKRPYPLCASV